MKNIKETLELALEALEAAISDDKPYIFLSKEAIIALREALTSVPGWASEAIEQPRGGASSAPVAKPHEQSAERVEPVAVVSGYYGGQCVILPIDPARIYNSNTPLYTAPQPCPTCEALARTAMLDQTSHDTRRKWQGLTDDEIWREYRFLWPFHPEEERKLASDILMFARAVEAKLREKNT